MSLMSEADKKKRKLEKREEEESNLFLAERPCKELARSSCANVV